MTPTFPLHEKAFAYAEHCIGVKEVPLGSNRGPIQVTNPNGGVDFFQTHDFVNGGGYAWCACFWLTCWAEVGHPFPYLSPGAYSLGDWAKANGMSKPVTELVPGDGCVWNEGAGHISMFESYDSSTGTVHTIDGNWGDQVMRATHSAVDLRVGIHISETPTNLPKPPQPYFVIATSVNGHKKILFSKFATRKKVLGILPRILAKYGKNGVTVKRSMRKPK